jgi:hypothetical protein
MPDRDEDAPRATQDSAGREYISACGTEDDAGRTEDSTDRRDIIRERPLHGAGRTHIRSRARQMTPRRRRSVAAPGPIVAVPA